MKFKLIACAAMAFARAYAQETPPVVEVKASADTQRREDSAARIVVNREEILRQGDANVLDVMRRLPGVTVAGGGPRLRGLGAGYTQLLVNGERPMPGFSLETLAPDMIERIEIIRATMAEFSAQAVAGTINIVLRKAAGKRSREWKLNTGVPWHFSVRDASLALSDKNDSLSYTVNANLTHIINVRSENNTTTLRDNQGAPIAQRSADGDSTARGVILNLNSRLSWHLAAGETISWNTFGNATLFRFDREWHIQADFGPNYPYGRETYWRKDVTASLRSELAWSLKPESGARFDMNVSINGTDNRRDRTYAADSQQGAALLARSYRSTPDSSGVGTTGKYLWPVLGRHTLSAGWDSSRSTQREGEIQDDAHPGGAVPLDFRRRTETNVRRSAVYLQDEWDIGHGLSLYAGVRRESSAARIAGSDIAASKSHMAQTSPTLQLLWKLPGEPRRQLRAALANSYKAPELAQLVPRRFLSLVNTVAEPDSSGNPALRPETARGFDLAFEAYGKDGNLLSFTVGTRRIDDVILDLVRVEAERWVQRPRNQGRAQTHSLEMEWKHALAGTPWKLSFNAGRHWSEVAQVPGPGNTLARQPRWNATASAEYRNGPWGGGSTLVATASGWSRVSEWQSALSNRQRMLTAYLSYRPAAGGQLRLTAWNLLRQPFTEGIINGDAKGSTRSVFRQWNAATLRLGYERPF